MTLKASLTVFFFLHQLSKVKQFHKLEAFTDFFLKKFLSYLFIFFAAPGHFECAISFIVVAQCAAAQSRYRGRKAPLKALGVVFAFLKYGYICENSTDVPGLNLA